MMTYLKHVGGKKHADLKNKNFEEIQVMYKKVKRSDKDFIAISSVEDERQIKEMNEESKDPKMKRVVNETPREEDISKEITPECIELILWGDLKIMMESSIEEKDQELEDGTIIYMLVERKYPLFKELLQRMLDLGLEVEEERTTALHLVRFIKQQLNEE
ncbi:hypothetical protein Tco_0940146 [Tanacetum coccineum]|uniref:Uncharacterized protein n=1 Tax=Tanacetum coccineum TaxID=301880 RepID=A0ABQ5DM63_9ASTR